MTWTFAGAPYGVAALLIVGIVVVAARPLRGETTPGVGAGSQGAVLAGAGFLALLGGVVEWRAGVLAGGAEPEGELLSTFPTALAWTMMVPMLAVGTAITAAAVRQLLRGRVRGAAGWIGLAALGIVIGLQETGRRLWVSADAQQVHVRSGLLWPRAESVPLGDVEAVLLVESAARGVPNFTLSLFGENVPGAMGTANLRFADGDAARAEAARWSERTGAPVREEKLSG